MSEKKLPPELLEARPALAELPGETHPDTHGDVPPPPAKYTPGLHYAIIKFIESGHRPIAAARMAGITADTFHRWMQRGKQGDPHLVHLVTEVEIAEGKAEGRLVDLVSAGAVHDPELALKMLERRWPEAYAKDVSMRVHSEMEMVFKRLETLRPEVYEEVVACLSGQSYTPVQLPPAEIISSGDE